MKKIYIMNINQLDMLYFNEMFEVIMNKEHRMITYSTGATLPYEVMPDSMQKIVNVLPLTQGIKILKNAVLGLPTDNVRGAIIFMILIAVICSMIAVKYFRWE